MILIFMSARRSVSTKATEPARGSGAEFPC
jgi:hypothetical protein